MFTWSQEVERLTLIAAMRGGSILVGSGYCRRVLRVVLLAGPGVDVVSQASLLAEDEDLASVTMGDIARARVQVGTALGVRLRHVTEIGERAPDELLVELFADAVTATNGRWVVSNFPGTVAAAQLLDRHGLRPHVVVELAVSDKETAVRLQRTCSSCRSVLHVAYRLPRQTGLCDLCGGALGLPDEVVAARINHVRERLLPVAAYYRAAGRFHAVDGTGDYSVIAAQVAAVLPRD